MFPRLLLLFLVVAFTELYLLLQLGRWIGAGPTVAWVLGSALLGTILARTEGLRVWRAWQRALLERRIPEEGIVSGVLVLIGSLLLIVPGVITDLAGLLLIFPPTRRLVAARIRRRVEGKIRTGAIHVASWRSGDKDRPRIGPPR